MDAFNGKAADFDASAPASSDCDTNETTPARDAVPPIDAATAAPTAPADDLPPVPTGPAPDTSDLPSSRRPTTPGPREDDTHTKWRDVETQILARLDLAAEYRGMGAEPVGNPSAKGWQECHAVGRKDDKASAAFNVSRANPGRYRDLGGEGLSA